MGSSPVDPEQACTGEVFDPESSPEPTPPPDEVVVLEDLTGSPLCLGPALASGDLIESATSAPQLVGDTWGIELVFTAEGIAQLNEAAGFCAPATNDRQVCPTQRLAIVSDARVVTAPVVQMAELERDQVVITGGFHQAEASVVSTRLEAGGIEVRPVLAELGP